MSSAAILTQAFSDVEKHFLFSDLAALKQKIKKAFQRQRRLGLLQVLFGALSVNRKLTILLEYLTTYFSEA